MKSNLQLLFSDKSPFDQPVSNGALDDISVQSASRVTVSASTEKTPS